jgi:hypothetical protein
MLFSNIYSSMMFLNSQIPTLVPVSASALLLLWYGFNVQLV